MTKRTRRTVDRQTRAMITHKTTINPTKIVTVAPPTDTRFHSRRSRYATAEKMGRKIQHNPVTLNPKNTNQQGRTAKL